MAKITCVVAEITFKSRCIHFYTFKVVVITSSVVKFTFVVADIMFKVAVITSSVTMITFVVTEITFKVAVITSSVAKITFVVAEITFKSCDDHFFSG